LTIGSNGNYYATGLYGGNIGYGSIFMTTNIGTAAANSTTDITLLYSFTGGDDGANPTAGLTQGNDGNFYGTTTAAGSLGYGTLFNFNPSNNVLTTLVQFGYFNGATPYGGVIQATNGVFYGTTSTGGTYGNGTVFQYSTNTGFATIFNFNYISNGDFNVASLTQGTDGNLYGVTSDGGLGNEGTVFQITTNGDLTTLIWFDGFNGAAPQTQLFQASNGLFYGTCVWGGAGYEPLNGGGQGLIGGGLGTVFSFAVPAFVGNPFTMPPAVTNLPYTANLTNESAAPPGDTLTFALISGPSWLSLAANGAITGTPAPSNLGTNVFVVSLTDANGVYVTATMLVPVVPIFTTNSFTLSNAVAPLAYSNVITSDVVDPSGDPLTFSLVSGPSWLSMTTNGIVTGTPALANVGLNVWVVSATNTNGFYATATMNITVIADPPPVFVTNTLVESAATVGVAYSNNISTKATNTYASNGDFLSYGLISGPAWLSVSTNGVLSGTPPIANAGTNTFVVAATNAGGSYGTATMLIPVYPLFTSSSFTLSNAVAPLAYSNNITNQTLTATNIVLSFALVSGPSWLSVATNGVVTGTPPLADLGTNVFVVSFTNTNGVYATATMNIDVIADPAPIWPTNTLVLPSAIEGLAYSGTISNQATNTYIHNGDFLIYGLVSGPTWLNVATNGLLSGTPGAANLGTNTFIVGATNAGGGSTATRLIVVAAPGAPSFVAGLQSYGTNGFKLTFTGPSGQTYEILASTNLSVTNWTILATGTFSGTNVTFTDTNAVNSTAKFYEIESQ
jgi:uncharacterized repeat protein (TIGR03803 family)